MKINNSHSGPKFSKIVKIKHHTDRFAFDFSFFTKDSKYNPDSRSKTINKKAHLKLLDRITQLSQDDRVVILNRDEREGLEKMLENKARLSIHPDFKKSKRYDGCDDDFWIFRLGDPSRVIGKIGENIFYIMGTDTSFDQYNHGSQKESA